VPWFEHSPASNSPQRQFSLQSRVSKAVPQLPHALCLDPVWPGVHSQSLPVVLVLAVVLDVLDTVVAASVPASLLPPAAPALPLPAAPAAPAAPASPAPAAPPEFPVVPPLPPPPELLPPLPVVESAPPDPDSPPLVLATMLRSSFPRIALQPTAITQAADMPRISEPRRLGFRIAPAYHVCPIRLETKVRTRATCGRTLRPVPFAAPEAGLR